MATLFTITEGWTSPLDAQLLIDGATFDGSGMTIDSVIRDAGGGSVTMTTSWQSAATSVARIAPAASDFKHANGPYSIHFQVTDGSGKVAFFPEGEADRIEVHRG